MNKPISLAQLELPPGNAEAKALFEQYSNPKAGKKLRDAIGAQVVSWRWATASMVQDEPFEYEIYARFKTKGRWLKEGKEKKNEHVQCGFDAAGRIIYEKAYGSFEEVWLHTAGKATKVMFMRDRYKRSAGLEIHSVVLSVLLPDGRLDSLHSRFADSHHTSSIDAFFIWENMRLLAKNSIDTYSDQAPFRSRSSYEYDAAGELERISFCETDVDGTALDKPRTQYRRPVKGDTIPVLAAATKDAMLKKIPELVKQAALDEPLYALLLCYTQEDFEAAWPPFLVWGRQSWREQTSKERGYFLWAPDEIRGNSTEHELWLDCDEEIAGLCLRHKTLMSDKGSYASGKKLLVEVAKQLNELDWPAITPVTDDFVVVVVDNSCEVNPHKDMKACLTPERFALLKGRGWLKT